MHKNGIMINPLTKYYHKNYKTQRQKKPGVQEDMNPVPDCGETSYEGSHRLKGRKALITGGDSGIGRAIAIAYAREGADIVLNYLPDEEEDALEVQKFVEEAGQKIKLIAGDITNEAFCTKLVQEAHQFLDGLDILVLNAGKQTAQKSISDITTEQLTKTFETNVFSMFWIIKAALPYLKPASTIITTSSIVAFEPSETLLDYSATKGAIVTFTKALAAQLAPKGIRVNSVAPGPIWTALQIVGGQLEKDIPTFGQETLLKRAGQPVELAPVYVHLAADESSYTTGMIYGVTGGMFI